MIPSSSVHFEAIQPIFSSPPSHFKYSVKLCLLTDLKKEQKKISKFFLKKPIYKKSHQSQPEVPKSAPIQYLSTFPNLGRVFFNFLIEDDKP